MSQGRGHSDPLACAALSALIAFGVLHTQSQAKLSACLQVSAARDTHCTVWVVFRDKPSAAKAGPPAGARGLARRSRAGFRSTAALDNPVFPGYTDRVRSLGCRSRHTFKWANAASFEAPATALRKIAAQPFVRAVIPVRSCVVPAESPSPLRKSAAPFSDLGYGESLIHLAPVGIPQAHDFIADRLATPPGTGLLIGVFDSGFLLTHRCFSYINQHASVEADSDFVENDGTVDDGDAHGAQVLSLVAGYVPDTLVGAAWGARFVLARTEAAGFERHIEEDNWVAALVWAESLGVDIITSSLGYRYDFDAPDTDYVFEDMDGRTTTISRMAAEYADQRGVIIVNSMGNEAGKPGGPFRTVSVPADADGVISVGGVTPLGDIASFSSRGPTADGRIKPDLVAVATDITVPLPSKSADYTWGGGTSFSAPVVASIAALVAQTHPSADPSRVKMYLFASCRLTADQDSIDNTCGRGLPNASVACAMEPDEVFLFVRDTLHVPAPGVQIRDAAGALLGVTDSEGSFLVALDTLSLPSMLTLSSAGFAAAYVGVAHTPWGATITLQPPSPAPGVRFVAYPSVMSRRTRGVTYEVTVPPAELGRGVDRFTISVRTAAGSAVWNTAESVNESGFASGVWALRNRAGATVAPGSYLLVLTLGNESHLKKLLILE